MTAKVKAYQGNSTSHRDPR